MKFCFEKFMIFMKHFLKYILTIFVDFPIFWKSMKTSKNHKNARKIIKQITKTKKQKYHKHHKNGTSKNWEPISFYRIFIKHLKRNNQLNISLGVLLTLNKSVEIIVLPVI